MQGRRALLMAGGAALAARRAGAQANPAAVRIGVLTDMSTQFAAWCGRGSVVAAQMAAQDFAAAFGSPFRIEVLQADHQNKPDIASSIARRWYDAAGVNAILDVPNSAAALAVNALARDSNHALIVSGSVTEDLTGAACSPNTVHWTIDSWALGNGTGRAVIETGGDTWFFVTSDFAGGRAVERAVRAVIETAGGRVLGSTYPPLGTADYAAFLARARASRAKVIGLSMSGSDLTNCIKQASEFGIVQGGQKLAALVFFLTDVHAIGLQATQGLQFTEAFYWDLGDSTRIWSRRFAALNEGRYPTQVQAGVYAGALHYLKAVHAAGSTDGRTVVAAMKARPTDDPLFGRGIIRADGRKLHDLHLFEVKAPAESREAWDYYRHLRTIPAAEAFRPLASSTCPLVAEAAR